jgi:hypothetical protein
MIVLLVSINDFAKSIFSTNRMALPFLVFVGPILFLCLKLFDSGVGGVPMGY